MKFKGLIIFLITLCWYQQSFSEKVGMYEFLVTPEKIQSSTVPLPEDVVAMSNRVKVGSLLDSISEGKYASVFFLIDHSRSNYDINNPTDKMGTRFSVAKALIDTINRINPKSEIGVGIFASEIGFDLSADAIFSSYPNGKNGYIPLLQLNKKYQSSALGDQTGFNILNHYLDTMTRTELVPILVPPYIKEHKFVGLKTQTVEGGGTNITAGFRAARDAMSKTQNVKENQCIIFISDGMPTQGGDEFVNGTNTPTTFTIFLTAASNNTSPIKLINMTNNIKNNGYSTANQQSNIWSIKTDYNKLMKLLMDNVIKNFISKVETYTPKELEINSLQPYKGWDKGYFTYKEMFPLEIQSTKFSYEMLYEVKNITVVGNDTTVTTRDTLHEVDYEADIVAGTTLNDSIIDVIYWGRKLQLLYKNSPVSTITKNMDELEIRFTPYKVDTEYKYDDITIEVSTVSGADQDIEEYKLKKKMTYFYNKFKRTVGKPIFYDNIVQHQRHDTIVVTFRNDVLPRDTLQLRIPYSPKFSIMMSDAVYFDRSADGHVDSLFIEINGEGWENHSDEILKNIVLPKFRQLEIDNITLEKDGFGLAIIEKRKNIQTYVSSSDVLEIKKEIKLDDETILQKNEINIRDAMAPVLMGGTIEDSSKIILTIKGKKVEKKVVSNNGILTTVFSEEPKKDLIDKIPFKFYRTSKRQEFDATLKLLELKGTKGVFKVENVHNAEGIFDDSIWINWDVGENIVDKSDNNQDNKKNIKRKLKVKGISTTDTIFEPTTLDFELRASVLNSEQEFTLRNTVCNIPEVKAVINKVKGNKRIYRGNNTFKELMVINVLPTPLESISPYDSFDVHIEIYDPLGNVLLKKTKMGHDKAKDRNKMIYLWNGENVRTMGTGPSAYCLVAVINHYYRPPNSEEEFHQQIVKTKIVGVKR